MRNAFRFVRCHKMQHGYGQKTCTFPARKSPEVFLLCQSFRSNYSRFCKCMIEATAVRQAAADRFDFVPSSEMPQLPTVEK